MATDAAVRVRFAGRTVAVRRGANLRRALLRAGLPLYNAPAGVIHCRGMGTCGTCAVAVEGSPEALNPPTRVERWRLGFPPHAGDGRLRLACQCRVLGDLALTKYPGLWGQHTDRAPVAGPDGGV